MRKLICLGCLETGMLVPLEIPSRITKIYFEKFGNSIQSISLNTCEVVKNMNDLSEIKQEVQNKNGRMTWFSCCSPEDLNTFIKSPLIESRLTGWFKKRGDSSLVSLFQ